MNVMIEWNQIGTRFNIIEQKVKKSYFNIRFLFEFHEQFNWLIHKSDQDVFNFTKVSINKVWTILVWRDFNNR